MIKFDYFEALESLASYAADAASAVCSDRAQYKKDELSHLRAEANKTMAKLESTLFLDFLPPLGREDIAILAHALSSVIDAAHSYCAHAAVSGAARRRSEEDRICVTLAEELRSGVRMLRTLKKSDKLPDVEKLRELIHSGSEAHAADIARIGTGNLPVRRLAAVLSVGRLRAALSRAFDTLVEVMLGNI